MDNIEVLGDVVLEDLGNIGEFVGAIGVVASLLYLSWEVRRNTRIQLRTNHRASQEELHNSVRPAAESTELSELTVKAMENLDGLGPGQRYQFDMYMMCWLQNAELMILDFRDGLIGEETLEPYRAAIAGHLRTPGGTQWWRERQAWFTQDGKRAIDEIINAESISGLGGGVEPHHE